MEEIKREVPEELKESFETIAKWLSENDLYGTVTIHLDGIGLDTGDIKYSVHLG